MDEVTVQCPYCFEQVQIAIESDVQGTLVQDCEVCCRPWQLHISRTSQRLRVRVERAQ